MPTTYAAFIEGQEDADLMPNEVAYHLAQLLGCPHYAAHRALIKINPKIKFNAWDDALLPYRVVGVIAAEIKAISRADTRAYLRDWKNSLTIRNTL